MLMKHSQAYVLNLAIITDDNDTLSFAIVPILSLTRFVMAVWRLRQVKNSLCYQVAVWAGEVKHRAAITSTVLTIGFNALSFGLGVSL